MTQNTKMLTPTQLSKMLELQASMNAKVNPNWREAGYPFLRASVVEGAEAMEHHGWKWWKKQEMDKPQFAMELVDIWHFKLSHIITLYGADADTKILHDLSDPDQLRGTYFDMKFYEFATMDTLSRVELLIGLSAARRFSVTLFETLLTDAGMDWETLYKTYIGKNVLNFFRQDNGYKQGTYVKIWFHQEDNVWLADFQSSYPDDTPEQLYARLAERYAEVVGEVKAKD